MFLFKILAQADINQNGAFFHQSQSLILIHALEFLRSEESVHNRPDGVGSARERRHGSHSLASFGIGVPNPALNTKKIEREITIMYF